MRFLERRFHLKRKWAAALTMLAFIGIAAGIVVFLAPRVVNQGTEFYNNIMLYGQDTAQQAEEAPAAQQGQQDAAVPENSGQAYADTFDAAVAQKLYTFVEPLPDPWPSMLTPQTLKNYVHSARVFIMANLASILKNQIMPSVVNAMSWAVYMIIVPIFMFLMLANKQALQRRVVKYLLPSNTVLIKVLWPKLNSQLESYINGSLMHIAISALANCLLFWAFGLNYGTLLGVCMGFSVVIPYVGAVLVGVPVLLIAAVQFGFVPFLGWFLAAWLVLQLADSYALTPLLFSKTMDLDAFSILLSIMVFGTLWGFWGVFFSIPLARFIATLITQWPRQEPEGKKSPAVQKS